MPNKLDFKQMEQWRLNDYAQFFDESHKKFGQQDSELYQNVKTQFAAFMQLQPRLQNTPITSEFAAEIINTRQKLADACSAYMQVNGNRRVFTGTGQRRVEVIKNLDTFVHKLYSEKHLERLREPLIFNANAGKTLNQLNIEPTAHIQGAALEDQVGGNASERYKVTYQGKRGFFTQKEYVRPISKVVDEMVNAEKNPEHKKVLEAHKQFLKDTAADFEIATSNGVKFGDRIAYDVMKYWDSLPGNTAEEVEKKKNFAGQIANGKAYRLMDLINRYWTELDTLSDADRKDSAKRENTFHACLNAYCNAKDYEQLSKCSEMIVHYAETREPIREGLWGIEAGKVRFEQGLYMRMANNFESGDLKSYQEREVLTNPDIYEKSLTIMKKANMAAIPMAEGLGDLKENDELSGRNVASSRVAELLGVGNLLAHSEKMTVQMGDKEIEGCFMEFAEGVDIRNGKEEALEQINQIRIENSPGFTRDACNLEVLDYLCSQIDRHGGNMFLKLSEPQADGKREILGLQGIDNDLAFSTREGIVLQQCKLDDLCFISENLAQNILATDRNKLQFVLGDILNEAEIDAMDMRLTKMKDHIEKHMIQVKDDEWALDRDPSRKLEQTLAADPEKLSRYHQGVNSLNEDLDSRWGWHKISHVGDEIEKAQERYRSLQAEHAAEAVQAQDQAPEAAAREQVQPEREQVQPEREQVQPEREPVQLERAENPTADRQVVKESLKMWLEEDARSKRGEKADMSQKSREKTGNPTVKGKLVQERINQYMDAVARVQGDIKTDTPQKPREIELGAHRRGPHK